MHDFVNKNYPRGMGEEMSVFYLKQIMLGFVEIRKYRVMHRDLKPGNLFLKGNNRLVIGDFGFAKYGRDQGTSVLGRC